MSPTPEQPPLTRIVVVPGNGQPVQEFWADIWELSHQDGGRTLKLFASGNGVGAMSDAAAALARDFTEINERVLRQRQQKGQ